MTVDTSQIVPDQVLDLLEAFRRSKTLFAAVALGVFDALDLGSRTNADLAECLKLDPEALARLLDACVALRFLDRQGDRYANTAVTSKYLTRRSPTNLCGYIRYANDILWPLWGHLEGAIREGTNRWRQTFDREAPMFSNFFQTEEMRRDFYLTMHGQGLVSSPHVVAAFDLAPYHHLIDVGGATGHLAIAACRIHERLKATVFDLPEAEQIARESIAAAGLDGRIEVVTGDFFKDALPEGDLIALGRVVHDWTETNIIRLLERVYQRLPSRGALLIAEKLLDDERNGPVWAHIQDLGMLLYTEGKERTLQEYEVLLRKVGFVEIEARTTTSPLDAVLAVKP